LIVDDQESERSARAMSIGCCFWNSEIDTAINGEDFRNWLKKNHKKERKIEIILDKRHTGKPAPTHKELMEEAICFGWIDTIIKKIDNETYLRTFVKRNEKSKWSNNTLSYAKDLIKRKVMTPEGLKFYKLGLKILPHDHNIPKNPEMPEELKITLDKNKKAKEIFNKYPPSKKKMLYKWSIHAKLPETKTKRINRIIQGKEIS
tara:strand:- start:1322 stop:1933 length:612 start_codon:yes stop_codon:yes gene_type:complete